MLFGGRACTWFLGEAESEANVGRELDSPPRVRFNASRWRLRNSPGEGLLALAFMQRLRHARLPAVGRVPSRAARSGLNPRKSLQPSPLAHTRWTKMLDPVSWAAESEANVGGESYSPPRIRSNASRWGTQPALRSETGPVPVSPRSFSLGNCFAWRLCPGRVSWGGRERSDRWRGIGFPSKNTIQRIAMGAPHRATPLLHSGLLAVSQDFADMLRRPSLREGCPRGLQASRQSFEVALAALPSEKNGDMYPGYLSPVLRPKSGSDSRVPSAPFSEALRSPGRAIRRP